MEIRGAPPARRALALASALALAAAYPCNVLDAVGPFLYSADEATVLTFKVFSSSPATVVYNVTCSPPSGWSTATATMPAPFEALSITFDERPPLTMPGSLDATCTIIDWGGASAPWCAHTNPSCSVPADSWWAGGEVHLVEVSHSDVGWLGTGMPSWGLPFPDLVDDTMNIAASLDMMAADPNFAWQHECMLFMRCFVEMYPAREAELVARIAEGRFDIGATWTEGLESTQLNELMARQMYMGRKWFVERYPGLDSAVVAFHQDGPLRAIQTPQVWRRSGVRYLKSSRWSDQIVAWHGADDNSSVLAMTEVHYGQANADVADLTRRLAQMGPLYRAAGLPPVGVQAVGTDYSPPTNYSSFLGAWNAQPRNATPTMRYGTFHSALKALDVGAPNLKHVRGERPNLWYIEGAPPHHNMFDALRGGARSLPAAETWATWRSLVEGSFAASYPEAALGAAWLNLTLNDHGIAGEPTPKNFSLPSWFVNEDSPDFWDLVYADKWSRAAQAGRDIVADSQAWLAARVNLSAAAGAPPAPGGAIVNVFNPLSWTRAAPVEAVMTPCMPRVGALTDSTTGVDIDSQLAFDDASGCTLVFVVPDVPAFGYKTVVAAPGPPTGANQSRPLAPGAPWTSPFTNAFYTITPATGGLASMVDLATGKELFNTSELLAGEWVSLTYTGMGASETREYAHAQADGSFQRLSQFASATWSVLESGPVRTVFGTAPVQTNHSVVSLRLDVWAGVRRVDLRVHLGAWDSAFGAANRVSFPVRSNVRQVTYAAPFGVVRVGQDEAENGTDDVWLTSPGPDVPLFERAWAMHPREVADWMHAEGDGVGVILSSPVGVMDFVDCSGRYAPTQPVLAPELMLHTDSNRGPFLPEPGDHDFLVSIAATPPGGGWAASWRAPVEANNPATVVWRAAGGAPAPGAWLPPRAGLVSVIDDANGGAEDPGSWLTALKKQDDGVTEARSNVVARVFNVDGVDRPSLKLRVDFPVPGDAGAGRMLAAAARTNLIELEPEELPGVAGTRFAPVPLGHWAIETLSLDFGV